MCFGKCARCIGYTLFIISILCIVANILLYFPNGETKYAKEGHLTTYVWYFLGIVGAGVLIWLPAGVFISLEHDDCCGCCGHKNCGKGCAMFSSILAAVIGLAGSAYCVIISAVALHRGPYCLDTSRQWTYYFTNTNGEYLINQSSWSDCIEPKNVVTWNVTLFAILLGLAGIEFILCLVQIINAFIGGICSCCGCRDEQQSYACWDTDWWFWDVLSLLCYVMLCYVSFCMAQNHHFCGIDVPWAWEDLNQLDFCPGSQNRPQIWGVIHAFNLDKTRSWISYLFVDFKFVVLMEFVWYV